MAIYTSKSDDNMDRVVQLKRLLSNCYPQERFFIDYIRKGPEYKRYYVKTYRIMKLDYEKYTAFEDSYYLTLAWVKPHVDKLGA